MKHKSTKEESFDSIYESYAVDVYHACLYLTSDESLAEEMTQQAFVNFYESKEEVKPECVRAYLIRAARNLIFNYYRHAKYETLEEKDDDETTKREPATASLEEDYIRDFCKELEAELSADILADLKEHHDGWYQIMHMMFYEEKSHDTIAAELGITKEILYSRLHRAKLWIRKKYETRFQNIRELT